MAEYGQSGARDRISSTLISLCTQAGNPILNQAQVADLATALGDTPDTDTLNRITVFAR